MSRWFEDRRMEFIAATFRQFGQIRRKDIVREFNITEQSASTDIQKFLRTDPRIRYDLSSKCYVLEDSNDKK